MRKVGIGGKKEREGEDKDKMNVRKRILSIYLSIFDACSFENSPKTGIAMTEQLQITQLTLPHLSLKDQWQVAHSQHTVRESPRNSQKEE